MQEDVILKSSVQKSISSMPTIEDLKKITTQCRRDVLRMTNNAQSGHPGGALGCADFITALYYKILEHDPKNFSMDGKEEDIFLLSNGHICPILYSVLARQGYFDLSELSTFRKIDSRLQGHPATKEGLPGMRLATGSLGQGMSVGIGAALSKRLNGDKHLVYTLHGDGEMQEGQNWEALMYAAYHKVDNLIVTLDLNGQQIDGPTENILSLGDIRAKWLAFGFEVLEMNGNKMEEVLDTLKKAKTLTGKGKPVGIIMKTIMGYPVDFMMNDYRWHGVAPDDTQLEKALAQLEETLGDY